MKNDYLSIQQVSKVFGEGENEITAVDDVTVAVAEGELVTLLGPSGCGKTTTLRMIAGFEHPSSGSVYIDGEEMTNVPPNARPTTLVFQNYALFPHMTVADNIAYGLRVNRVSNSEIHRRVEDIMALVGLKGRGGRSPAQLSGGQQQRVSLARSLVMEPKVLLLDEPLSNLDAKLRVATRLQIRRLQQRLGITSVYVTHDQEEAMVLSDRVVIMRDGRVQQVASPHQIYARPANRFVADFVGKVNFIETSVEGDAHEGLVKAKLFDKQITLTVADESMKAGDPALIVVRPESIRLGPPDDTNLKGKVTEVVYLGSQMTYRVEVRSQTLMVDVPDPQLNPWHTEGEEVSVIFEDKSLHVLPYEPPPEQ